VWSEPSIERRSSRTFRVLAAATHLNRWRYWSEAQADFSAALKIRQHPNDFAPRFNATGAAGVSHSCVSILRKGFPNPIARERDPRATCESAKWQANAAQCATLADVGLKSLVACRVPPLPGSEQLP